MATYVVGDLQGCIEPLQRLLEKINFNTATDTLWATGDLVNRGPDSLEVLRFFKRSNIKAMSVLGNHDLHLLAVACGQLSNHKPQDTLHKVLSAPDRIELLEWLRHLPILHYAEEYDTYLLHAGIPPQWSALEARAYARELEACLRGPNYGEFFRYYYGETAKRWSPELSNWERLRFIASAFTRLRYCSRKGKMLLKKKLAPEVERRLTQKMIYPWFQHPDRQNRDMRIVCGHWSTLGYYVGDGIYALDTGCLWGGRLTALRLDDFQVFQVGCDAARRPQDCV